MIIISLCLDLIHIQINTNLTTNKFELGNPMSKEIESKENFNLKEAQNFLDQVTASWIKDLGIRVTEIGKTYCAFSLDHDQKLVRSGGIVCGQAIVSAADTVMIVAVTAAIGGYEQITTVDISCKFLRPLLNQGALIRTEMIKVGKLLVVGRIIVTDNKSKKIAAEISCTYARV